MDSQELLFQPPARPSLDRTKLPGTFDSTERRAALAAHREAVEAWEVALAAWEAAIPQSVGLVFEYGTVSVHCITRDPSGCWRTTAFSCADHMPVNHTCHRSRLVALREERGQRLPRIPFQVEPLVRFQPGNTICLS